MISKNHKRQHILLFFCSNEAVKKVIKVKNQCT